MTIASMMSDIRRQFPGLRRQIAGQPVAFFDGPAGTQVPQQVIDAVTHYYANSNANTGGQFATSRETDSLMEHAHQAVADLVGADDRDTVVFGPNMTTLTFALSRSLARSWKPGDEIVVTRLDHDANVTPWVMAAADAGATVKHVNIHREDCTLDMEDFSSKLSERTRLVAVGCASNATGTVNPVRDITRMAHEVGAIVFLDAVHLAPHALIDVEAFGCDFLACSAYKFFGPHVGMLWGKRELLEQNIAYQVRPASCSLPGKWMTGTQNHEGIAGTLAAIEYIAALGRSIAGNPDMGRRNSLTAAYCAIEQYESELIWRLIRGLADLSDITIWGITDPARREGRLPTISMTHARRTPAELALYLAERGMFVWHGNYYALSLTEALGLEPEGMVRIGLTHYNTAEEVDRLLHALTQFN